MSVAKACAFVWFICMIMLPCNTTKSFLCLTSCIVLYYFLGFGTWLHCMTFSKSSAAVKWHAEDWLHAGRSKSTAVAVNNWWCFPTCLNNWTIIWKIQYYVLDEWIGLLHTWSTLNHINVTILGWLCFGLDIILLKAQLKWNQCGQLWRFYIRQQCVAYEPLTPRLNCNETAWEAGRSRKSSPSKFLKRYLTIWHINS